MATPTVNGQASVNGLLLGKQTPYRLLGFNPWSRTVRSDQADHAFQDGAWSGREFADAATIPMRIRVEGDDAGDWLALHQDLAAAFAPASADVELRFMVGDVEYLMLGRPRTVDPDISLLEVGAVVTAAAFVALDPAIYSATEHQVQLTLPSDSGGLTFPATFPATIDATITAGRADITNAGTRATGLVLRIDGPVQEPRVTLLTDDGPSVLRYFGDLEAGQWLDIDTRARTVYLNGTASRRGLTGGDWPLLPPGTHEFAFDAGLFDADALLTATWRDAWQ